jgi:hypothetical protein
MKTWYDFSEFFPETNEELVLDILWFDQDDPRNYSIDEGVIVEAMCSRDQTGTMFYQLFNKESSEAILDVSNLEELDDLMKWSYHDDKV